MKGSNYDSRREQIEKDFLRDLMRDLRVAGVNVTRQSRERIKDALRDAAMVGACEERHRTLKYLQSKHADPDIGRAIMSRGVLSVLGYEEEREE